MPDVHVRVELIRSGGFAGLMRRSCMDTEKLASDDTRELRQIVHEIDLRILARQAGDREPMPDSFQYELTIIRGEERASAVITEHQITAELLPLIRLLNQRGQSC